MAAVTRARALMMEHGLTESDLLEQKMEDVVQAIREAAAYTRRGTSFAIYDDYIANAVDLICATTNIVRRDKIKKIVQRSFVGTEHDVSVALALFETLLQIGRDRARLTMGSKWSRRHTSFVVGFGARLLIRAKEEVKLEDVAAQQTTALVLRKKEDAINAWLDHRGFKTRDKKPRNINMSAYQQGWRQGGEVSLNPRGLK